MKCGRWIHARARRGPRAQAIRTCFFRNRPELAAIERFVASRNADAPLAVAVLGCSRGAEVYSLVCALHAARPDLERTVYGVDISEDVLAAAREARYASDARELQGVAPGERARLFDEEPGGLCVKPHLREGITWLQADVRSPGLRERLGAQDLVIANRFLCHMAPDEAESCLRNILGLLKPGAALFVSGVDLDVRSRVTREHGLEPLGDVEALHEGDATLREGWPWQYWGLEPIDRARPDWRHYYASAFRRP
jgi:chemotaxis methyl-accepting protein methylase